MSVTPNVKRPKIKSSHRPKIAGSRKQEARTID